MQELILRILSKIFISGDARHLHVGEYNVKQGYVIYKAVHVAGVVADFYLKSCFERNSFISSPKVISSSKTSTFL